MKNWKHYGIICFLLILFLTFIFIACDNDNDPQEQTITIDVGGVDIRIIKMAGVTDE